MREDLGSPRRNPESLRYLPGETQRACGISRGEPREIPVSPEGTQRLIDVAFVSQSLDSGWV